MSLLKSVKSGKKAEPQLICLYGPEGIGKSTWASKLPKPIFADTERSTGELNVNRLDIDRWEDILKLVDELIEEDHDFETLVIDTFDSIENEITSYLCKKEGVTSIEQVGGGYGKGWVKLQEVIVDFFNLLNKLRDETGMHVVILAHARITTFKDPQAGESYDRYSLKLHHQRVAPIVKERCKNIFFMNTVINMTKNSDGKKVAKDGRTRLIYTNKTAAFDAKNRHGLMEHINPEWDDIKHIFQKVVVQTPYEKLLEKLKGDGITQEVFERWAEAEKKDLNDKALITGMLTKHYAFLLKKFKELK